MKLSTLIKTIKIEIPGTGVEITLRDDLSWYDYLESLKIENADERGTFTVTKLIEGWNLTDDDDKPLEITDKTVRKLPKKVAVILVQKVNQILFEKSKKKKK